MKAVMILLVYASPPVFPRYGNAMCRVRPNFVTHSSSLTPSPSLVAMRITPPSDVAVNGMLPTPPPNSPPSTEVLPALPSTE